MTPKQESAMRLGLAALERVDKISGYPNNKKTITTLREALNHIGDTTEMVGPEQQEPVAQIHKDPETGKQFVQWTMPLSLFADGTKFYTSPPQRHPWVGLTEEEWRVIDDRNDWTTTQGRIDAAEEIEEKLKEKNT